MKTTTIIIAGIIIAAAIPAGCTGADTEPTAHAPADDAAAAPTNRVDIPSAVRRNLGITFATVESRHIERTLRVPGRFEFLPTARREYRTMLAGRVELQVKQYERVEAGQPLYKIDAPGWRELQQRLVDLDAAIRRHTQTLETFDTLFAAHHRHEESLRESITVWQVRLEHLEAVREAGGGRLDEQTGARAMLATARSELAAMQEKDAELHAKQGTSDAELDAARARRDFLLTSVSTLVGVPSAELSALVDHEGKPVPRWMTIDRIEIRAEDSGIVESLGVTNGAWADQESTVLTAVKPDQLRFHAQGLQSDLGRFRDGLAARIVPPVPTRAADSIDLTATMDGVLALGISGHPDDRTIDLYVTPGTLAEWARPGVSAHLEVVTDGTSGPVLAVPMAAVQRDGLAPVLFRRDPSNPDEAIRLEGDLGMNDGRWVEVMSGVGVGDAVVLDGAFQLMLATSGSAQKGGHFHADGTFHEGED